MRRNLGRRELIEPSFVTGSPELPLLDSHIETNLLMRASKVDHDTHQRFRGCTAQRANRRFVEDGIVIFEGAVSPFRRRAQAVQLPVSFCSSGDFQNKAGRMATVCTCSAVC